MMKRKHEKISIDIHVKDKPNIRIKVHGVEILGVALCSTLEWNR